MDVAADTPAGAQIAMGLVAVLVILLNAWHGLRKGPVLMAFTFVALACAYGAGLLAGGWLLPVVRPVLPLPDFAIVVVGGVAVGILVYAAVSILARIIFKRTGQQSSAVVRVAYGFSGAAVGMLFGVFVVWLLLMGVNLVGTVAQARVDIAAAEREPVPGTGTGSQAGDAPVAARLLAGWKRSLDADGPRQIVEVVDVVPEVVYKTLGGLSRLAANPSAMQRFLDTAGAREIAAHPLVIGLGQDPEISERLAEGRYLSLLTNRKLITAANDPELAELLKKFDLPGAMDYALGGDRQGGAPPPAAPSDP